MIYLKLATPFNPGSYDADNTYPHAFITVFNMDAIAEVIEIRYEYGNFDPASGWSTGRASVTQIAHIQNEDFYAAIAAKAEAGSTDSVLMEAARQAYNYLIAKGLVQGTVIEGTVEAPAPAPDTGDAPSDTGATGPTDDAAPTDTATDTATDSGATAS